MRECCPGKNVWQNKLVVALEEDHVTRYPLCCTNLIFHIMKNKEAGTTWCDIGRYYLVIVTIHYLQVRRVRKLFVLHGKVYTIQSCVQLKLTRSGYILALAP